MGGAGAKPAASASSASSAGELLAFVDARVSEYKPLWEIKFVDALPRNAMGKPLQQELVARLY